MDAGQPMGFRSACLEMVRSHTADWVFCRVRSIKMRQGFYYGFAIEVNPPNRTVWFKDNMEQHRLGLGPVAGMTDQDAVTPPEEGSLLVGCVIPQDAQRYRYEWWYRDAAPFQLLVHVAHDQWQGTAAELRQRSRYAPDHELDNLWVLIRIVLMEDLDMLAEHREMLCLDRSKERFVCDVAQLFGQPAIFYAYQRMLQRFRLPCAISDEERQEMQQLEEMMQDADWW